MRAAGVQFASVLILLVSTTGVFLPLEVALNRVWGVTRESFLRDESTGGSGFGGRDRRDCPHQRRPHRGATVDFEVRFFRSHRQHRVCAFITHWLLQISAAIASVLLFFLIYYVLPNS